ncbi:MAG: hypothetical protein AUI33_07685 [Ignavibacteria bacterium 13_1_40CM_2_61_4]|nr:MAG: hypothetical protein AUI33_07685 [Ignavibacteria bacterium 13_1_40CM_2_61_4]
MIIGSLSTPGFLICLSLGLVHAAMAGETDPPPAGTNLEIMQSLIGRITRDVIGHSRIPSGDTVLFRIRSSPDSWIVQNATLAELRAAGYTVLLPSDSGGHTGSAMHIHSAELRVRYDDMYHDGFLGARKVRRTVSVAVACDVIDQASHEVLYSGAPAVESADTVRVDEIPNLELASARSTHAELPPETFPDRVLEPLVIIGATGVAVYLFFHVRS